MLDFPVNDALSISGVLSFAGTPSGQLIIHLNQAGITKALLISTDTTFPQNYTIKIRKTMSTRTTKPYKRYSRK